MDMDWGNWNKKPEKSKSYWRDYIHKDEIIGGVSRLSFFDESAPVKRPGTKYVGKYREDRTLFENFKQFSWDEELKNLK